MKCLRRLPQGIGEIKLCTLDHILFVNNCWQALTENDQKRLLNPAVPKRKVAVLALRPTAAFALLRAAPTEDDHP